MPWFLLFFKFAYYNLGDDIIYQQIEKRKKCSSVQLDRFNKSKDFPHELGQVVQQKMGMVTPTRLINGELVNDSPALEREADLFNFRNINVSSKAGSSVIQRMPWHTAIDFPRDKLVYENIYPTTPMTGYKFLGYTYPSRNVLNAADQTSAITSAAEFIGNINPPKSSLFLKGEDIKEYKDSSGASTYEEDQQAFSSEQTQADKAAYDEITRMLSDYVTSKPTSGSILERYILYQELRNEYESNKTNSVETIREAFGKIPNYGTALSSIKRNQIGNANTSADIENILNNLLKSIVQEYKKEEIGYRKTPDIDPQTVNLFQNKIDPFHIEVRTSFPIGVSTGNINLHYQFSVLSYGYVVKVERGADSYRMANNVSEDDVDAGYYSSAHNKADLSCLKNLAVRPVVHGNDSQNNITFDAVTKLAGEGSRWECVRQNAQNLANDSKFYTINDGECYYVTFEKLWGSWKTVFKNAFNIKDSEVIDKLINNVNFRSGSMPEADFVTVRTAKDYELVP